MIDRAIVLWSNPNDTVMTPFMGVGSEVWSAVKNGRRGLGVELKPSYYRQAVKNMATVDDGPANDQVPLFGNVTTPTEATSTQRDRYARTRLTEGSDSMDSDE